MKKLNINSMVHEIEVDEEENLLNVLREHLRLTGTKRGCDIGLCGTCAVLINGQAKRACRVHMKQIHEGDQIETIEGLAVGDQLHPIQEAFIEAGAIQCGFCTPGMIMTTKALLDKSPNPSREEIRHALMANLCRCTGYQQIFEAVELAAKKLTSPITE